MSKFQTPAQAQVQRTAIVESKTADLVARLTQEAAENGIEAASRAADAAILGAVRWMALQEGGHDRIAEITAHLHAEARAAIVLRDAPAASEARQ